jgi:hypothetical protein
MELGGQQRLERRKGMKSSVKSIELQMTRDRFLEQIWVDMQE